MKERIVDMPIEDHAPSGRLSANDLKAMTEDDQAQSLLDMLALKGINDADVSSAKEWFDRKRGKAPQSLTVTNRQVIVNILTPDMVKMRRQEIENTKLIGEN